MTFPGLASGSTGLQVRYVYTRLGYEERLVRHSDGAVYARTLRRDAAGRTLEGELVWAPNAVRTARNWDEDTGRLLTMGTTGPGGSTALIEQHAYQWDGFGNLFSRQTTFPVVGTTTATMAEQFRYDTLHRLTRAITTTANTGQVLDRTFSYDGIGNLTLRTDVGTYNYPAPGQPQPHAPSSIMAIGGAAFALNTSFTYDADGNMLTGAGRTALWSSFSMPTQITLGGLDMRWWYGPERQRIRETRIGAFNTLQVDGFAGNRFERRWVAAGDVVTGTSFLAFGGETVALATETSTAPGVITTLWQLKDHLGSTTALLDALGHVSGERMGYDAWGKRRFATGEDDAANSITSASNRGFTGHEFLEEVRLVHMNGRVYDPIVARFLSADPVIQDPLNLQSLNRYSYVLNNPLAFTDPTGFFSIGKFLSRAFGGVQKFFQRNPIAGLAVGLATAWVLGPTALGWLGGSFFSVQSAIIAGTVRAPRPLEDHDLPGRAAPRWDRRALGFRRTDPRRVIPGLDAAVPGAGAAARRHRRRRSPSAGKFAPNVAMT